MYIGLVWYIFIADLVSDPYWSSMTWRHTNGERSLDAQVFRLNYFCMVGIRHIPNIFPPGGNMLAIIIKIIIVIIRVQEPHCGQLSLQPWLKVFVGPGEPFQHHQHRHLQYHNFHHHQHRHGCHQFFYHYCHHHHQIIHHHHH